MPTPKRKVTRSRRRKRQASNSVLAVPQISHCPQCGEAPYATHHACPHCGFYKGRQVITVKPRH